MQTEPPNFIGLLEKANRSALFYRGKESKRFAEYLLIPLDTVYKVC